MSTESLDSKISLESALKRLRFLACHPKTPKVISDDLIAVISELEERLREEKKP